MMKTVYSTHIVNTCIWLLELQIVKIDTCIFNFSALYFEYKIEIIIINCRYLMYMIVKNTVLTKHWQ